MASINRFRYLALKAQHALANSNSNRFRHLALKVEYALANSSDAGLQNPKDLARVLWKSFNSKLTYLHWIGAKDLPPAFGGKGAALLVRKLPAADPRHLFVDDLVVLKDPYDPNEYLVRVLDAFEGYGVAYCSEKDEPVVLEKNECWVSAVNHDLSPEEAWDSRLFGPVPMTSIVGRVIYILQNAEARGPVWNKNSPTSFEIDSPVWQVELDVEEMVKNLKE